MNRLRRVLRGVLVWQLGPSFADDITAACPHPELAEEIVEILTSEDR